MKYHDEHSGLVARCPLYFLIPFSRSSFKSACILSLLADQQPENFCSIQHCLKCPRSNSLLPTALWDTNVSPLGPARNYLPLWSVTNNALFPFALPKEFFTPQNPWAFHDINLTIPP